MAIIKKRKLSEEEKRNLTEEELKNVDGGAMFIYQFNDINGHNVTVEIIDDITGNVVKIFENDLQGAYRYCKQNGYSDEVIEWPELKKLREDYKKSL